MWLCCGGGERGVRNGKKYRKGTVQSLVYVDPPAPTYRNPHCRCNVFTTTRTLTAVLVVAGARTLVRLPRRRRRHQRNPFRLIASQSLP
jgi:hypothetical protein